MRLTEKLAGGDAENGDQQNAQQRRRDALRSQAAGDDYGHAAAEQRQQQGHVDGAERDVTDAAIALSGTA